MAEITHAILTSAKSQKFLQVIGYSNSTSDCEALINGCMNSLDWTTGLDYWTGLLDSLKNVVLHHFESK